MNAQQAAEAMKAHSDKIRSIIRGARGRNRQTEKDVNDQFYSDMAARGLDAPHAIMTKVRDTRRDFILTDVEAEVMANVIKVDVNTLIAPATAQGKLPILDTPGKPPAPKAPVIDKASSLPEQTQDRTPVQDVPSGSAKRPEAEGTRKIEVGIYPADEGLRFVVNKLLTESQFERLTLAIPEYMMQVERRGEMIMCRANVPIFSYQAELLTRAIYGGK